VQPGQETVIWLQDVAEALKLAGAAGGGDRVVADASDE